MSSQLIENLKSIKSFTRTIDRNNLRNLNQISSDLQIIFLAFLSHQHSSRNIIDSVVSSEILKTFVKPLVEDLIWRDESLDTDHSEDTVTKNSGESFSLIELCRDRLRCLRSEIVALGWRSDADGSSSSSPSRNNVNDQETEGDDDTQKFRQTQKESKIATLICWILSVLASFEEAKHCLEMALSDRSNKKSDQVFAEVKRSLVAIFVESQSLIVATTEISSSLLPLLLPRLDGTEESSSSFTLTNQIDTLFTGLLFIVSSFAFTYYKQQPQVASGDGYGPTTEIATASRNSLQSWKLLEQRQTKIDHKAASPQESCAASFLKNIEDFCLRLLGINQLVQITYASEIGYPLCFRPAPADELLARKELFK